MITIGNLIIGAAVTFVVSSAGRTIGEFWYDALRDLYGSKDNDPGEEVKK